MQTTPFYQHRPFIKRETNENQKHGENQSYSPDCFMMKITL